MFKQVFARALFGSDFKPAGPQNPVALEVVEYEGPEMSLVGDTDPFKALREVDPWADTQIDFT